MTPWTGFRQQHSASDDTNRLIRKKIFMSNQHNTIKDHFLFSIIAHNY